ncbi:MAG: tryptophan--tRNA ligase [Nanoarchaeota archaeon]|nr:tryptophan--tRNA ligase [Nanoarchaeota archaeon]
MAKVTPWEVSGDVDYDKLIKEFGTEAIDDKLLKRIKKHTGELHPFLKRGLFFSHRDINWLLDQYEKGNEFFLYTGRGPSGKTHIGHLLTWILTKWLQDKFDVDVYFQITDDEKFLFNPKLSLEETNSLAYENALDFIALGFNPNKTHIIVDTDYAGVLYREAIKVAKKITFSTVKAVFGFKNDANIGQIFYTSMQAVPAFLPSVLAGKKIPCLIPHGIDQDAHFRVTRDVIEKLGYYKPAAIHSIFVPGLKEGGKMSSSDPYSTIFTTDEPSIVKKKVGRAFTGGKESIEEQRKNGGKPQICTVMAFFKLMFEGDMKKIEKRKDKCESGDLLCGECKKDLAKAINSFLAKHQAERKKARKKLKKFLLKK